MFDVRYPLPADPVATLTVGPVVAIDSRGRPRKPSLRQMQIADRLLREMTARLALDALAADDRS